MTQPQQSPQQPDQGNAATIVGAAAIALALISVENQIRQEVHDAIDDALVAFAALLVVALAVPGGVFATGTELMADKRVHAGLVKYLNTAQVKVTAAVAAGYAAGAQVALAKLTADLKDQGYDVPADMPPLGTMSDTLTADVATMFGHAQTDIANRVAQAYDGVQGDNAPNARLVVTKQAVTKAGGVLQQRAAAAAGTSVQQGSGDAQQAIFTAYENTYPGHLMKQWVVTSHNPCGMCEALNGTMVAISAEFDYEATTVDKDLRPVWHNLLAPPRHPNCRCQLQLVNI